MNYHVKKTELLLKQEQVMKKYNELAQEVDELVVGMQGLLEQSNQLALSDWLEWLKYITHNEEIDKTFRLAAALHYVETPDDRLVVSNLKSDMRTHKIMMKRPKGKK